MDDDRQAWDIRCGACDITIGQILGGRFVHDPECALPRRIEGGTVKCCRCGGALSGQPRSLLEPAPSESRRLSL